MQQFDPDQLEIRDVYALMTRTIVPRPIVWVSSCSADGYVNLAPFSYFNGLCSRPPAIMFSPTNWPDGREKDTTRNIRQTEQFVVNIVPHRMADAMVKTSGDFDQRINEFDIADLQPLPSLRVRPPRVAGSPVQMECQLIQIVNVGTGALAANVIIGQIILFHVDPKVIDDRGRIDAGRLDALGRLGGREYCTTRERFEVHPDP